MKFRIHKTRLALAGMVLVTAVFASVACADVSDTMRKSFTVKSGGNLTIDSDRGSIRIKTGSGNTVEAVIVRRADVMSKQRGEDVINNFQIEFNQDGNDVEITGKNPSRGAGFFDEMNRLRVEYTVTVPKQYNVNLQTAGGSIDVDDLNGQIYARTAGGSLTFGNSAGPVNAKTAGGSIRLQSSQNDVELKTAGGSITIGGVEGDVQAHTSGGSISIGHVKGSLEAKTAGGSISIDGVTNTVDASTSGGSIRATLLGQPEGDCRLSTSAGGVSVDLPENVRLNIEARTMGGKIFTDLPITVRGEISKSKIEGMLNGGGPLLELKTSAGNISISKEKEAL